MFKAICKVAWGRAYSSNNPQATFLGGGLNG